MARQGTSKLVKTLGVYTFANILNSAIPFLLLPFLTNYLLPSDYAIVDLFQAATQFAVAIVGVNTFSALSRFYFDLDNVVFKKYVGNSLIILLISALFLLIIAFVFKTNIHNLIKIPRDWIWLVVVYAFSLNIIQTLLSIWQVKYKAVKYGTFRILRTVLDVSLSIFFVLILKFKWDGRILGQILAVVLFAILAILLLIKNKYVKFDFDLIKIKKLLSFGSPLIIHILGAVIITYSDRVFIVNYIGLEKTGMYSVGYQVGMIVYLVQTSFNQAWVPWFFEKLKSNIFKDKLKIIRFTYLYYVLILLLAVVIAVVAPFIYKVFIADSYINGIDIVVWIALGFAFNGMYKMVGNYIFYIKKTYIISIITLFTAGLNIVLNYFMVNNFGAVGVAQASAISFFTQFILTWIISSRMYKMPWLLKKKY